ncbi:MAG: hypothetical protein NVSMB6_00140 [Burkholderiaceae bacterium]
MASQVVRQADYPGTGVNHGNSQMNPNQKLAAWTNAHLDLIAFGVGLIGFALFVAGIGFIYWPAALIVAGAGLLMWSFMAARAVATRSARKMQDH